MMSAHTPCKCHKTTKPGYPCQCQCHVVNRLVTR
jgi:hypothetical protein